MWYRQRRGRRRKQREREAGGRWEAQDGLLLSSSASSSSSARLHLTPESNCDSRFRCSCHAYILASYWHNPFTGCLPFCPLGSATQDQRCSERVRAVRATDAAFQSLEPIILLQRENVRAVLLSPAIPCSLELTRVVGTVSFESCGRLKAKEICSACCRLWHIRCSGLAPINRRSRRYLTSSCLVSANASMSPERVARA